MLRGCATVWGARMRDGLGYQQSCLGHRGLFRSGVCCGEERLLLIESQRKHRLPARRQAPGALVRSPVVCTSIIRHIDIREIKS